MANTYQKNLRSHREYFHTLLILGTAGVVEFLTEPVIYYFALEPFRNPNHPDMPLPPHEGIITTILIFVVRFAGFAFNDPDTIAKIHAVISALGLLLLPAYTFYKQYRALKRRE